MARHRFDPVSLVCGGLAIAAGVVVLVGGELTEEARLLLPAGLVALGVALLVRVARRPPAPAAPPPPAVPSTVLDPDDDLFAPRARPGPEACRLVATVGATDRWRRRNRRQVASTARATRSVPNAVRMAR
jgi:hypothetical protein